MPDQGDNAIHHAADAIRKLATFDCGVAAHAFLGKPTLAVTMMSAGTAVNMNPAAATITMDIRTLPGQTETEVQKILAAALRDAVEINRLNSAASVGTDERHEWVQQVFDVMEKLSGKRAMAAGATDFTDCSVLTPAFGGPPMIVLGPGEPEMADKTDEFCCLSKIELAVEAYTEIA